MKPRNVLALVAFLAVSTLSAPSWAAEEVMLSATGATGVRAGESFEVAIEATLKEGWHIYAIADSSQVALPTRVKVLDPGPFRADGEPKEPKPKKKVFELLEVDVLEHHGTPKFRVPLRAPKGLAPGKYPVKLQIVCQPCNQDSCLSPVKKELTVQVTVVAGRDPKREVQVLGRRLVVRGWGLPEVRAGEAVEVELEVLIDRGWHIYSQKDESGVSVPTLIGSKSWQDEKASGPWRIIGPVVESKPKKKRGDFGDTMLVHEMKATFRVPVKFEGGPVGDHKLVLYFASGACDARGCDPPEELRVELPMRVVGATKKPPTSQPRSRPAREI